MLNLGQVSSFFKGSVAPTNKDLLWRNTVDSKWYFWNGTSWILLSAGIPTLSHTEYTNTAPATLPNPPVGNVYVGSFSGRLWIKDNTGKVEDVGAYAFIKLDDAPPSYSNNKLKVLRVKTDETGLEFAEHAGAPTYHVVPTHADMMALTAVRKGDKCFVTNDPDVLKNGEYIAAVDNPTLDSEWHKLPIPTTFVSLSDTPNNYTGLGGTVVRVKTDESGVEFLPITGNTFKELSDTPDVYVADYNVLVNAAADGIIFQENLLENHKNVIAKVPTNDDVFIYNSVEGGFQIRKLVVADIDGLDAALGTKEEDLGNPTSDGQILSSTVAGARSWIDPTSGGASTFKGLSDTPATYVGQKDKVVKVKTDESGLEFSTSGGGDVSTGLEKVTVGGKTGMRVIDAADVAGVNTNALNLDVTAKVTDIGTNSIAIGALPKASGDASIVIGSSHGPDRVVAKASTSVIIGAATSGSMIIEEGSMGSAIIGGKNIKIDRFHPYTAVIAGEDITTKQSHTVYIPTLKFKGYDTNDIIDRTGVESGTMMYDQQRRIFMRYTGDDWHTESPSGLEHVIEDVFMAPMVGAGVSGSTTFTSGGVEDQTAILVAGLEVFTFALTNGTHIHTKVVSSSLNTAGHTVVIVEDAFPYDMIVLSYPASPAQNGWNFHRTPAITTGDDAVNLMSSGDASQDNMVYVSGIKYKSYTTAEIAILPDSELGTVVFDSSQNRLSQCTNATPGANVWSGVGGDLSQIHQELRKEFTGVLVAGTIPAYTFTIETATGDVTSEFPDNAIFILGGGGLMAAPYTVGTATFVGGSTVINFVNPYPDIIPAFTKILADDNWGWKLGDTSLQLTGSGSVNLLGAGMGDATQPNITYVGGIKYTSYTTVQINALPGTEAGTVVYDSDKDALQYYNGTAWMGLGGGGGATTFTALTDTPAIYTDQKGKTVNVKVDETGVEFIDAVFVPKRFEALATAGQTVITLEDNVRAATTVNINGGVLMSNKYIIGGAIITLNSALSKDDEIVVINMGDPILPEIEIKLVPGQTSFGFKTNSPFTVEQDGATVTHPAATTGVIISGMNDGSFIKITVTNDASDTTFDFNQVNNILHAKLNSVGKMTVMILMFTNLTKMTTFECAADLSGITNFRGAWTDCSGLTSFPALDTSSGTDFNGAWTDCSGLTSFPALDTSSGTDFNGAWTDCSGLTSFPALDTSSGTDFNGAWIYCSGLTSFPAIDTSSGTDFEDAWYDCSGLTSFPAIDTSSGTDFNGAWNSCAELVCIAGTLDFRALTEGTRAFESCDALTAPAPHGTPVRNGNNATAGTWTNPNPCP